MPILDSNSVYNDLIQRIPVTISMTYEISPVMCVGVMLRLATEKEIERLFKSEFTANDENVTNVLPGKRVTQREVNNVFTLKMEP